MWKNVLSADAKCVSVQAPVALPLLVPYLMGEDVRITPTFLSALAGSFLAGATAVYCGVKNRGFVSERSL